MKLTRANTRAILAAALFLEANIILVMLFVKPSLADVKLFEILAQAVIIQGLLGLVMAFYFAANADHAHGDPTGRPGDPVHTTEDRDDA
ncbi:MAG: hypothetical protein CMN72_07665 [Sphingomonas sp.]|nr:hypothetical protein [Sphingomonas sp.]